MSSSKLRTKAITVKITLGEWMEIREVADKADLCLSDFVRKALNLPILNKDEIKKQKNNWNKKKY